MDSLPSGWIDHQIRDFCAGPENTLRNAADERAWAEPLIGYASGDDLLWQAYKTHVGPQHWTPAEIFAQTFPGERAAAQELTVIAWILPQTEATKADNRAETRYPAERWARSRIFGEEFNSELRRHVTETLSAAGYNAVAPHLSPGWARVDSPQFVFSSTWSERHAAYAAGLGTFGLCDGLITPAGKAVRVGSVVARISVPSTSRPYTHHRAYCTFYADGSCGECIARCPAGALTVAGHDKRKCEAYVSATRGYVREQFGFAGYGCGLCQTGVPCESDIPGPCATAGRQPTMREPPDLAEATILAALRAGYDAAVARIAFLPLGNDATAAVYRAWTLDTQGYFVKLRNGPVSEPALVVPLYLSDCGIAAAVGPLPTRSGLLWQSLGDWTLILYPFIAGRPGMDCGLSPQQWAGFGAVIRQAHACTSPAGMLATLCRETFIPKWAGVVRKLAQLTSGQDFKQPSACALAAFWRSRQTEIAALVARTEEPGQIAWRRNLPRVICHADMHTANVLVDAQGRLFLIDWDEALLAPQERDLMFVVEGAADGIPIPSPEELWFRQGYGDAAVDPFALAYYRYEWVVQEIGDFGERVFLRADLGVETKKESVAGFQQLFARGDVVERVREKEQLLPIPP